jgi:hypothetical protein
MEMKIKEMPMVRKMEMLTLAIKMEEATVIKISEMKMESQMEILTLEKTTEA